MEETQSMNRKQKQDVVKVVAEVTSKLEGEINDLYNNIKENAPDDRKEEYEAMFEENLKRIVSN